MRAFDMLDCDVVVAIRRLLGLGEWGQPGCCDAPRLRLWLHRGVVIAECDCGAVFIVEGINDGG